MVLVIGWTCLRGFEDGIIWALIGGLCLDLVSGAPFGLFTLALVVVTIIASLFHGRLFGSSIVLPLILTFPLSVLFNGLVLLALNLLGRPVIWDEVLMVILVPVGFFNTVVMLIIFPFLYMLNRWLNPRSLSF
jgi:rod shape-determining protein MreD